MRLFGAKTSGFVSDFPGRIEYLANAISGALGTADKIVDEHTLFRLYSRFRPRETMERARLLMKGHTVERLKSVLGLPASRANTAHPLKYCRSCAKAELVNPGLARWWVHFQWPTVLACSQHGMLLDYVPLSTHRTSTLAWKLPSDLDPFESMPLDPQLVARIPELQNLAELTTQVAKRDCTYTPQLLRLTFLSAIQKRGWATTSGTVQIAALRKAFLERFCDFSSVPGLEFIAAVDQNTYGFLGTVIRGRNRYLHPSKYLLMIAFLFDDFESFYGLYAELSSRRDDLPVAWKILSPDRDQLDQQLRHLVVDEKHSLNHAAQLQGISISRVIAWAKANSIPYDMRPHRESAEITALLLDLISRGASREAMASALGVGRRWITAFFDRKPELRQTWRVQNLISETERRREAFLKLLQANPGIPLSAFRLISGNGYQWLKKHDGQWLAKHLPMM